MASLRLSIVAASIFMLSACGGGGGGSDKSTTNGATSSSNTNTPSGDTAPTKPPQSDPSNVKGLVFDGPVSNAKVICDSNRNGQLDVGEISATTTGAGQFNMACAVGTQLIVLSDGAALDTSTKQPMRGVLYGVVTESSQGFTQLNSLTTLAVSMVNAGASVSDAENQIRRVFDIPASISIYGHHPASNANLLNAILSTQTTLLSAVGEIAFVNRAVGASDNTSINTVHAAVNSNFAKLIGQVAAPASWTSLQGLLSSAVKGAIGDLSSNASISQALRSVLSNPVTAEKVAVNAYLAGKIASDSYIAGNLITEVQLQGLDLTKALPASVAALVKSASSWTTRFDPVSGAHYNTSKLPVESTYVDSIAGFMRLDDGGFIDPRMKEDGSYALPVEITEYDPVSNSITILFNRTKDHLSMGLVEEIQFDPFSNPTTGFTIMQFKPFSSPDELLGSGHIYGNVLYNTNVYQAIVPIGKDNIKVITLADDPRVAIGVRLILPKFHLRNGDRVFAMWNDTDPQDNHSFVLLNSGQRGKGVSQMVTQTFEVKIQ